MQIRIHPPKTTAGNVNRTLILVIILFLVAGNFFHSRGTLQSFVLFDLVHYSPKEDAAVLFRHSSLHNETLNQLPILQQRLNISHGHTARIQTLVVNETEAVRSKNAILQQENATLEHNMTTHTIVNRTEWRDGMVKSFDHFLMHIPKTGCTHARGALTRILKRDPQWNRLLPSNQYRLCDVSTALLANFPKFDYQYGGVRCTMWMSEQPYSDTPMHTYTILRSPRAHVLSQYFHCTESRPHKGKAKYMPKSLDVWVDAWVDAIDNQTKAIQNRKFRCYSPMNKQSSFVLFDEGVTKEMLRKRYDIIGDSAQMQKTLCLILIRYAKFVPSVCNCTGAAATGGRSNTGLGHSHGVTHHGATFNTTLHQEEAIAKLTMVDEKLYEMLVQEIFVEQVQEIETEYQVTICDTFRS
jgi:hypothetical protein